MTAADTAQAAPARQGTFAALYRLVLRMQFSVPQMLGIGALSALAVIIGLFARFDDNPEQAAADAVASYGLGILVPLATLWLGTSALGNLMEDRLLVYLWLKPVPRWQLPAAAVLATAVLVIPLTALPLTASVLVAGASGLAWPTLLAASLGALAYSGLFVAAGLWFSEGGLVGAGVRRDLGEHPRLHGRGDRTSHGARLDGIRARARLSRAPTSSRRALRPSRSSSFRRSQSPAG